MKSIYYLHQIKTGKNFRVEENQEVTIGRAFDNTLMIDDNSVSRYHAQIKWKKNLMYITDLQSTNGTSVNGEKVEHGYFTELNFSDLVKIGNLELKILDEESVIGKNFTPDQAPAKTIVINQAMLKKAVDPDDFTHN
ncbi:FHA domain-containing protein [bacterium]|nr:FHA domain-containing protein [bacterium]NUN45651.1 FHA domain-containing protein [bacterium]